MRYGGVHEADPAFSNDCLLVWRVVQVIKDGIVRIRIMSKGILGLCLEDNARSIGS